jgi:hypothetical protein
MVGSERFVDAAGDLGRVDAAFLQQPIELGLQPLVGLSGLR